jgi:hypothetical protein
VMPTASIRRVGPRAKVLPPGIEDRREAGPHGLNCAGKMKVATSAA